MSESDRWERMFRCLGDVSRRRLFLSLLEKNAQDDGIIVPEDVHVGARDLTVLQLELVHVHLPKLEAHGYIEWNRDEHRVERGPRFGEIRPLLELLVDNRGALPDGLA